MIESEMSRPTPKRTRKGMNLTFCLREMSLTENVSTTRVSAFVIRCPRSLSNERMQQTGTFYHDRCKNGSIK